MNTLMNRFFSKAEAPVLEKKTLKDQRHQILNFLIEKGTSSQKLKDLIDEISRLNFPENSFKADLLLVQWYLKLETYLLRHDSKYINTPEKLRNEVKSKFTELTSNTIFAALILAEPQQELAIALNFITYFEQRLTEEAKERKIPAPPRRIGFLKNKVSENLSMIERINRKRKIREFFESMYAQYTDVSGEEFTQTVYTSTFKIFYEAYSELKTVQILKEFTPQKSINNKLSSPPIASPKKDITAITPKALSNVSNSNTLMSDVLENMLDGIIICNRNGDIIASNSNAVLVFGLTKKVLAEKTIHSLVPQELSQALQNDLAIRDPLIKKHVVGTRFESEITTANGNTQEYEISITNNYTEGDDTFTLVFKDITGKKETLQSIQDAKKNAERMANAKSTFLSNMSHEIRTPLNVILGLSEIISKKDISDPEMLQKNVEGIDFSAKNLLSIVNDILDFSKIEAGKLTIQAIDFNLGKVVNSLANGFEIKAREKGVELEATIDKDIPNIIIGDQYRLNQILNNLIGNAIKFTQNGKISILVHKEHSEKSGEVAVQFKVKDTGIGIPKDKLQNIFESFYQVDSPESAKITGTGLGLAITKELIELQHGTLIADSEVGVGSEFQFTLPFKISKLTSLVQTELTIECRDEKLAGLQVLVAEDNKMNQFYIKQLLGSLKVEVDIAENGKEAIEIFETSKDKYDLILMDMHMPIMDGLEAIKIIRKSNKNSFKKVPIVACSADVFPESRKNAIKAGIDFYLTKPLNEDAVKEVLYWLVSDNELNPSTELKNDTNSTSEVTHSSHVNVNKLRETFDNDDEFIISLLEIFIKETPEDYKSLRACIEREFYARASSLAHKMKSSFMNLGMTLQGYYLQQIESQLIKSDGLEDGKKHMTAFSNLYHKTLLEVNILLIELKQG
ncbi:ATP-binding protein [Cochleicola gelatinilyticus]|uniref:histidine kinase n=1 Tax=Cochleicola gelatinilyticus TaxID=1763537 RepID=A0A167F1W4_9FLAO|nr:ATP-binding protein [Cochleicola gelatinilyticus]OAB76102.1 hypothetical protein ULVI_13670 [Cochleicola gelatinilyticus]